MIFFLILSYVVVESAEELPILFFQMHFALGYSVVQLEFLCRNCGTARMRASGGAFCVCCASPRLLRDVL